MEHAEKIGDTLIVQAGAHGSDLGRLDLIVENGKIVRHHRSLVLLDHRQVPLDAAADRLARELLDPYRPLLEEKVGDAAEWLVRAQTLAGTETRKRDEESPVDLLFADWIREETHADFAFLPGVGYGIAIPPGSITAAQLRQLVPHDGQVVTMQLPGSRIIEILEQAVENVFSADQDVKVGGMIQVSGLRCRYNAGSVKGHRVTHIERTNGKWTPTDVFHVATNSMLANGGHNQVSFRHGERKKEHGSQFELIKRVLARHSPAKAPGDRRILPK